MAKTKDVSIQIDDSLKNDAEEILSALGLTPSEAVKIFFKQIVHVQGLPFNVAIPEQIPNETTQRAMEEEDLETFNSPEELYKDLGI